MWDIDFYDWKAFQAYRDAACVPDLLRCVQASTDENEWSNALSQLESCASDLGIPCSLTPPLVGVLTSLAVQTTGTKRSQVLSLLEELTCGRGAPSYTEEQRAWHRASVDEMVLGFRGLVVVMENASIDDARQCVDLLAYCAEHLRSLGPRVKKFLALCQEQHPELANEISAVTPYFDGSADNKSDERPAS